MHSFLACHLACIRNIHLNFERFIRRYGFLAQFQIAVLELGIGKSMAEWEEWLNFLLIVITISNKDSLTITDFAVLTRVIDISRVIFQTDGECSR